MKVLRVMMDEGEYDDWHQYTCSMFILPDDIDLEALVEEYRNDPKAFGNVERRWANGYGSGKTVVQNVLMPFGKWMESKFEKAEYAEVDYYDRFETKYRGRRDVPVFSSESYYG